MKCTECEQEFEPHMDTDVCAHTTFVDDSGDEYTTIEAERIYARREEGLDLPPEFPNDEGMMDSGGTHEAHMLNDMSD